MAHVTKSKKVSLNIDAKVEIMEVEKVKAESCPLNNKTQICR